MRIFHIFGIGANKILSKDICTKGTITKIQKSYLYVIKKPVRLYLNENNTLYSHYITFLYTAEGNTYTGKLFISPNYRCPQKGESIDVYYDPQKPENYACYSFGPAVRPIGW